MCLAIADDVQEQLFERRGRVVDPQDAGLITAHHRFDFGLRRVIERRRTNLGDVAHLQQRIDATEFLQFSLVQDRDAITNVLYVR